MITAQQALEFDKIKDMLAAHAYSQQAGERLLAMEPYMDEGECRRKMADTTSARSILDAQGRPPLPMMDGLDELLTLCAAGAMLLPEQLGEVLAFSVACKRVRRYLSGAETTDGRIAPYGRSIEPLDELAAEIERCIRHNAVDSNATPALHGIRRQMEQARDKIKEKLNSLLMGNRKWFSDSYVVQRNGRQVLPVKREYKNNVSGAVVEISSTRSTYFIEPAAVSKLTDQLQAMEMEEDAEVRKVLYTLTGMVEDTGPAIRRNMEIMAELDFIFAKAGLSREMDATEADINTDRIIDIKQGRHPLLDRGICVPLDFRMGCEGVSGDCNGGAGVIITGPNTGGKTVALKTVGLLSMMAQCGLHIPAQPGSRIAMHAGYYCDIGDSQSIAENLSTFSGHMTNIISILGQVNGESLVLLDELGSGTDPAEGMGIAIAVLEELGRAGCLYLVTTHYPEVKEYAEATAGVTSARMAFDRETLSPLYRLELGKSGESCALYIAQRLGLPPHILHRAQQAAYNQREVDTSKADMAKDEGYAMISAITTDDMPDHAIDVYGNMKMNEKENNRSKPGVNNAKTMLIRKQVATPDVNEHEEGASPDKPSIVFQTGDSVAVLPDGDVGIVYTPADDMGNVVVQVKGKKLTINHKRLELRVAAKELYPDDYDMSIVFDSWETRKARHQMNKKHQPGMEIRYD